MRYCGFRGYVVHFFDGRIIKTTNPNEANTSLDIIHENLHINKFCIINLTKHSPNRLLSSTVIFIFYCDKSTVDYFDYEYK